MLKQKFYPVGNQKFSFRAFTLIELMVVVAVIGLVASIILISLAEARARARDARILLNLRQVKTIAALIDIVLMVLMLERMVLTYCVIHGPILSMKWLRPLTEIS